MNQSWCVVISKRWRYLIGKLMETYRERKKLPTVQV